MQVSEIHKTATIPGIFRNTPSILDDVDLSPGQHVIFEPEEGEKNPLATIRAAVARFNKASEDKKYIVRRHLDSTVGVYCVFADDEEYQKVLNRKPRAPRAAKATKRSKKN